MSYRKKEDLKMTNRHVFLFEGGEELTTMGASWFVSYMWYNKIDRTHMNWRKVKTYSSRISVFSNTVKFHKSWLNEIISMKEEKLGQNKIQLSGKTVKEMAGILLESCK